MRESYGRLPRYFYFYIIPFGGSLFRRGPEDSGGRHDSAITAEYIARAVDEARRNKDQALLIELNTPGGLLDSTHDIINTILASSSRVIVYVARGPSSASAGFFHSGKR